MKTRAERNFLKLPYAECREGDSPEMIEAIKTLDLRHGEVRRPENNLYQLKLSSAVSYYPKNGRIHVDGETKGRLKRGLEEALAVLIERDELLEPSLSFS